MMESPYKEKRSRAKTSQSITALISFEIDKQTSFGQGMFVCGSLPELGNWQPSAALQLQWAAGNFWRGQVQIPKDLSTQVEFKFLLSQWIIAENCYVEWEEGANRTLDLKLLQPQSTYVAEWNRQHLTLCLRVHPSQNSLYYVTGSIEELGAWKEKKLMQPIQPSFRNRVASLIKNDPESLTAEMTEFQVLSLSVRRGLESFNYYYCRWGETAETESLPGRTIELASKGLAQAKQNRIADVEYMGERIIVDQSCFDELVLQKLTNQIYLASCLRNPAQFARITEQNITAVLHLQSPQESCSINSSRLKALCKDNGLFFQNWVLGNLRDSKFIEQAQEIIGFMQHLIVEGHRVCLHCSRKILREGPIKILYLTLLGGHTFMQAMEEVRKEMPLSESSCKVAEDVLQLVTQRMNRGRFAPYIN